MTVKRILVGLDGSKHSVDVLDTAIDFARVHRARLILFRAIGIPAEIPPEVWKTGSEDLTEYLQSHATAYLEACARDVPEELLSHHAVMVKIGSPWQAVCTAAEHEKADLVIVGTHGYGGIDRVLGTTAAKIVNHAPCSVLVVRLRRA